MAKICGRDVGAIGYGLMSLTWNPTPPPDEQSFAAMRAAIETGCTCWNGGDFYGPKENNSLVLLNKYFSKYPEDADKVVINIKGGVNSGMKVDGSPDFIRQNVESCLAQLGGKGKIDMFECARRDVDTPLEQTLGTLAELVKEGKIGGVALSEVNANTIREAAKITKIAAVEVELSLYSTDPLHNGIVEACAESNIPILAYSPVGRGLLTGTIKSFDDIPDGSFLKGIPRVLDGNLEKNQVLANKVGDIAKRKNCTPAQLALGWLLALSKKPGYPQIIPIPGTTKKERVHENGQPAIPADAEMKEIDEILSTFKTAGDRYPAALMQHVNL